MREIRSQRFLATIVVMSALTSLLGYQRAEASEIYNFYDGIRSYGMGGSYAAVVNDETSLLSNPAGLGKIRDSILTFADLELQGSFNDLQVTSLSNTSVQMPADLMSLLGQHRGTHWNAKAQVFPSLVGPNIGFGLHGKMQYDAITNTAGNDFRLDYTNDYAAVIGFCFRFWDGIIKVGGSARYVDRTEVHKDFDPTTSPSMSLNNIASEGNGLAGDAGIILTAPVVYLPSLAVVVRDAGVTSYGLGTGMFLQTQTRPADTPQTIDAGFALSPILGNHTRMTFTVDYHDLQGVWNEPSLWWHLHSGVEFNFSDFFFLRGGVNQGYWTAGFELSTMRFQIQAASYGEEIGSAAGASEDRRWVVKIAFRI